MTTLVAAAAAALLEIFLKPGVDLDGVTPRMLDAMVRVCTVMPAPCVVTSATEPAPGRVEDTLHPAGRALDFRVYHIPNEKRPAVAEAIREALHSDFDVVLEPDHLHVELDPRPRRRSQR